MPLGSIQSPILFIFLINNLDANAAGIPVKSGDELKLGRVTTILKHFKQNGKKIPIYLKLQFVDSDKIKFSRGKCLIWSLDLKIEVDKLHYRGKKKKKETLLSHITRTEIAHKCLMGSELKMRTTKWLLKLLLWSYVSSVKVYYLQSEKHIVQLYS